MRSAECGMSIGYWLLATRWCLPGPTKEKVLEFKCMGSKNGCLGALNRYFDRQNCRYKNQQAPQRSRYRRRHRPRENLRRNSF
jgi:hypothetical protein